MISKKILESYELKKLLIQSEEKFRRIFENAAVGIFQINLDGKFLLLNPAGRSILALGKSNQFGDHTLYSFFPQEESAIEFKEKLKSGLYHFEFENEIENLLHEKKYLRIICGLTKTSNGETVIEGAFEDFSQKKEAEKFLIDAKNEAEKSNRLKSEFLSQMSHEIRTPLNIMVGSSSIIEEELHGSENHEYDDFFDNLKRGAERIIRTIESILIVAELKTGAYSVTKRKLDMKRTLIQHIERTAEKLRKVFPNNNFVFNYPDGTSLFLGDEYTIQKLITHLLENSFQFTLGGNISVDIFRTDNVLKLKLEDEGIGMSEEFISKMFLPFEQEETGFARTYEGNGLGLTIVREFCRLNEINLKVSSAKNRGSIFELIFSISD